MNGRLQLIINADDLGMSSAVNAAIFKLIAAGRVTSSTVMMNGPAAEAAIEELPRYRQASFGIHLNITEFRPLTQNPALNRLCNENGEFDASSVPARLPAELMQPVFDEWSAQVSRALMLNLPISHLDSHHHLHTYPELFLVLKRVQRRFGIRKVRITRNVFAQGERIPHGKIVAKRVWNFALRRYYPTRTTDSFMRLADFFGWVESGRRFEGSIEVMCHPGNPKFRNDAEMLSGDWIAKLGRDVEMASYDSL